LVATGGFTGGVPTVLVALIGGPNLDAVLDVEELSSTTDGACVLGAWGGIGREDDAGGRDVGGSWYEG